MNAKMWRFHGGVHPPQHKAESTGVPVRRARLPKRLVLPLHQHIGEAAEPVVVKGERVLKGQMIARANGYVSAAVHAPTSGVVLDIGDYPVAHPSGLSASCIVIESDGEERWVERTPVEDYTAINPSHMRNMIREAGIVGLGGAGFPSFIKLNPGPGKVVDTLILNGIECEPYITCDDMLMRERPQDIIAGIHILRHALQAKECVIAIEDNKPDAYRIMSEAVASEEKIRVALCPTIYPQGSEKQLVQVLTGKEVPSNGLPIHVGVVLHNVGTAYAVHRAIHLNEPLISRYVTITGDAVGQTCNLEVLFGTPIIDLLDECATDMARLDRLIVGGPMMGFAMHTVNAPVVKTTNCVLATTTQAMPAAQTAMPCIRCGACMDVCPVNLLPQQLYWHSHAKEFERAQEYSLFDCIECGCCAYVCPSNIPLVQYYRYAKAEIWAQEREKERADLARRRHEFRIERMEREKAERAARLQKKKADVAAGGTKQKGDEKDSKKNAIQAAVDRARVKKEAVTNEADPPSEVEDSDKKLD